MSTTQVLLDAAASAAPVYGLTSGRILPTAAALLAAGSLVVSAVALSRARRAAAGPRLVTAATSLGAATAVLGAVLWATAGGGPGTGNGIVAAWLATGLGLVALALGAAAWRVVRRSPKGDPAAD